MHSVVFNAFFGKLSNDGRFVCLERVRLANGEMFRHHTWVRFDQSRMRNLLRGDHFAFSAELGRYMGLDEDDKPITKIKLEKVRSIRRLK